MSVLLIALGGAVGALARYLVDRALAARVDAVLPWGTLAVNVAGSGLLGGLAGATVAGPGAALLGIGFCGALTTWSTFGYETIRLAESGGRGYAVLNVTLTLVTGLAAAALGWAVTS